MIQGEGDHWRRQPWDPGLHPTEETEPARVLIRREDLARLDAALRHLDARAREIIERHYGLGGARTGESDTTIARSLGLSRAHVSYLRDRALRNCGG